MYSAAATLPNNLHDNEQEHASSNQRQTMLFNPPALNTIFSIISASALDVS